MSLAIVPRPGDGPCTAETAEMLKIPRRKREGFLKRETVMKAGAAVDLATRVPKKLSSMSPVLIDPGFNGIKPAYGDTRDALAYELERPAASMRRPRIEKGLFGWLSLDKLAHPDKLGSQAVVAAIDTLYEMFEQEVVVISHSMGGPESVEATRRRPGKVSRLVLVGSGGLEEGQSTGRLARRGPDILLHDVGPGVIDLARQHPLEAAKTGLEAVHYFARHPWRTGGEMLNISNRQLMDRELAEVQDQGVEVDIVQLGRDRFFPLEEATRKAPGLVPPGHFHVIPELTHLGIITQPEVFAGFIARHVLPVERPVFADAV